MFRRRPHPGAPSLRYWRDVVRHLEAEGATLGDCPALCRRKGPHQHMRHEGASADLIVSPSAEERGGA